MALAAVRSGSLSGVQFLDADARRLLPAQLAEFLARLGVSQDDVSRAPTLQTLSLLQAAFVDRVPYENISLHCEGPMTPSRAPELSAPSSVRRICDQRRGGYCFILVDAFASLLCTLGYGVSLHVGGCGEDPLPEEKWGNHVVLLVHGVEGRTFIADVGLGDGPAKPFELRAQQWEERGYSYALEARAGDEWRFTHDRTCSFAGFSVSLSSSCSGAHEFLSYHRFLWSDPTSHFRTSGIVVQRQSSTHGVIELRNATVRIVHPRCSGGRHVLAVAASKAEWLSLLREHFFLTLDDLLPTQIENVWQVARVQHLEWMAAMEHKKQRRRFIVLAIGAVFGLVALRHWVGSLRRR